MSHRHEPYLIENDEKDCSFCEMSWFLREQIAQEIETFFPCECKQWNRFLNDVVRDKPGEWELCKRCRSAAIARGN